MGASISIDDNGIRMPGLTIDDNGIRMPGLTIDDNGIKMPGMTINDNGIKTKKSYNWNNWSNSSSSIQGNTVCMNNMKFTSHDGYVYVNGKPTDIQSNGRIHVETNNGETLINGHYYDPKKLSSQQYPFKPVQTTNNNYGRALLYVGIGATLGYLFSKRK